MTSCKVIIAVTFMLIESVLVIPDDLWCCSAESGVFQYQGPSKASCWHETSNKTSPLRVACPSFLVILEKDLKLTIAESGHIFFIDSQLEEPEEIKREEVCYANYTRFNQLRKLIIVCEEDEGDENIFGYCMTISTVFLLLTSAVYAALPEVRDLQGKSIINFCGSMGIGLGMLAGSKLLPYTNMTLCAIRGFATYFFLIAAFFWSNAISVQILLNLSRPVENSYSWKQFSWYALYAWGSPALLTLCMAIVNFHPGDHKKPGIGLNHCWFYNKRQQWYYMFSVMGILIIANICIFIYTSVQLWRLSFSSNHVKALRYRFVMIFRLFLIMGVNWIFEMISSLVEYSVIWAVLLCRIYTLVVARRSSASSEPQYTKIQFVIDVFNTLQGPLIFLLLVVCRRRVVKALLQRGCLACVAGPVERYLAVKDDDEEGVIQQTLDVTMNDINGTERN